MFKILIKDMDSFEINKIIASILLTALIIIGIGKIVDILFYVEKPELSAYKVEGIDQSVGGKEVSAKTDKVVEAVDIKALLAMGDMAHGEKVFKKCSACHMIAADGKNKIGPKLWGVMFRPVASIADYKYSKALSEYKKDWSWEEMNGFLIKPSTWIKGNKMGFAGLKKEKDRASVILYLNQNSDNPKSLP